MPAKIYLSLPALMVFVFACGDAPTAADNTPRTDTAVTDTVQPDTSDTVQPDTTDTVQPDTVTTDTTPPDTSTDTEQPDTTVPDTADTADTTAPDTVSPGGLVLVDPGIHALGGAVSAGGILLLDAALDGTSRACANNVCVIGGIGK